MLASILVGVAVVASGAALAVRIRDAIITPGYAESLVAMQRPMILDPLFARDDPAVTDVGTLLYRSLMRLDSEAYPEPDLASSVKPSPDGTSYTIVLASAKWSDGTSVTAKDVVNSVSVVMSPGYADSALSTAWRGTVISVKDNALTVQLPGPRASFEAELTQLPILPLGGMNAHDLSTLQSRDTTPLPTSGPFTVSTTTVDRLSLDTNAFAVRRPKVSSIAFHLFGNFSSALSDYVDGHSDAIVARTPNQHQDLLKAHRGKTSEVATFQFDDMLINERLPGLDDPVVRTAMSQVISRGSIVSSALNGQGVPQPTAIPEGVAWAVPESSSARGNPPPVSSGSVDVAAALTADGWIVGTDGVRIRNGVRLAFSITTPDSSALHATAQLISVDLGHVGISADVQVVASRTYVHGVLDGGNFQLAVADWNNGPDPDLSGYWRSNATPPHGSYLSGGQPDLFLDQALDSLATVTDESARRTAAASVAGFLATDVPAVFLDAPTITVALEPTMKDVVLAPTGGSAARFASVLDWARS